MYFASPAPSHIPQNVLQATSYSRSLLVLIMTCVCSCVFDGWITVWVHQRQVWNQCLLIN